MKRVYPAYLPAKLSLKSLQVFAAICETGSFRAAGERPQARMQEMPAKMHGF